ncbi:MAG TPA: phage tail protein [Polyangia bacterium]|nr:phage tail protein [Polyangia bacterium]
MATPRDNPYGAFNFIVTFDQNPDADPVGGFSDVSGLGVEVSYSDYRNGNEAVNVVRKVPNSFKVDEITLKRGLVGTTLLFDWLKNVRNGQYDPRTVVIKLLNEARDATVASFKLTKAQPKKWVGPTLAAKGGGEVAMEELHLVHEGIEYT